MLPMSRCDVSILSCRWWSGEVCRTRCRPTPSASSSSAARPSAKRSSRSASPGTRVALHRVALGGAGQIWEPEHRRAAEQIALGRHLPARRHLRVLGDTVTASSYAVEAVDLSRYDLDGSVS